MEKVDVFDTRYIGCTRYRDLPKVKPSLITRSTGTVKGWLPVGHHQGDRPFVLFSGLPNYEEEASERSELKWHDERANSILRDSDPMNIDWPH